MHFVGKARSDWLTHIHDVNFTLIEIAVAMHVAAIAAYALLKGHNLVRPMITGKKRVSGGTLAPRMASPVLAIVILVVAVGGVALLVRLAS